MAAAYVMDPTGTVHLEAPECGGAFTYCCRETEDGDTPTEGFQGKKCPGPATCVDCKWFVDEHREAMKNVKWDLPGATEGGIR